MGFPTWTLWGMGLAALGALVAIALAFIAQTPRLIGRLGLTGARLDLRARAFTGYGLAFLLLALGFFLAGVPIGQPSVAGESDTGAAATVEETPEDAGAPAAEDGDEASVEIAQSGTAESEAPAGASSSGMVVRPQASDTPAATTEIGATTPEPTADNTPVTEPAESATVAPTVPPTATLFPTATVPPTPEPTQTPTPIVGPIARVGDSTSTLPVRKTPNGEPLALVYRGDTVLLLSGRAFHSGGLWREISTVDGVVGWVQDVFLDYGESAG